MTPQERKRQGYIHELIQTEDTYVEDLELVLEVPKKNPLELKHWYCLALFLSYYIIVCVYVFQVFYKPMSESGRLTEAEMGMIFVNWRELIMCNTKLLK